MPKDYMLLLEIKDFSALIDNKPFLDQPIKNKQSVKKKKKTNRNRLKSFSKSQETMTIKQKTY